MATGTILAPEVMVYGLSGQKGWNSATVTMRGNGCVIFGMRRGQNTTKLAVMVEYWNTTPWFFGFEDDHSSITITKASNSKSFTITKAEGSGAITLICLGVESIVTNRT